MAAPKNSPTHDPTQGQRRRLVHGSLLGVGVLLALLLFGMVNYLSMRHYKRMDWTASKIYTLSEKSLQVASQVDQEVEVVMIRGIGGEDEVMMAAEELLSHYVAANPTFLKKRVVDLVRDRLEAQQLVQEYEISEDIAIILATAEERRFIGRSDLAQYDYSGVQFGQQPVMQAFTGEEAITRALLELVEEHQPKVVFTRGHGEAPLDVGGMRSLSAARNYFDKENFAVETWKSLGATAVPEGTDLVVVAGPTVGFLPEELALFSQYLDGGGRLLVLLDPALSETGLPVDLGLKPWLAGYGVEIADDVIIDPGSEAAFVGPEIVATASYGLHPIVDPLAEGDAPVIFSLARSVRRLADAEGVAAQGEITELVRSSDQAWGETDFENLDAYAFDGADVPGPVSLGVAVSLPLATSSSGDGRPMEDGDEEDDEGDAVVTPSVGGDAVAEGAQREGRLVVLGDLDFATDVSVGSVGNSTLLLNTFNWLVQREYLISIERDPPDQTRLSMSGGELMQIILLVLVLQPGLAILTGIIVYRMRRR